MRKPVRQFLALLLTLHAVGVWLVARPQKSSLDTLLDELNAVQEFREVAISPDGRRVAWVEGLHGENGAPSPNSAILVADLNSPSTPSHRISAGDGKTAHAESDIAWSPDSRFLAFLSNKDEEGQPQLYIADVAQNLTRSSNTSSAPGSGGARMLTHLKGSLESPGWSPNGKHIALLFTENAPRVPGPLEPMTSPRGVIEQQVYEQRLATVDVDSGTVRQLSPPDLYVYEYDWSPDGKWFVVTAAHGAGDANWYIAELYNLDATTGDCRSIYKPPVEQQIAVPRWSPDGKRIAFIGGLMSDEGNTGGDIFILPAAGGTPKNLTPNINASPNWLTWPAPDRVLFSEWVEGESGLAALNPSNGEVVTLWRSSSPTPPVDGRSEYHWRAMGRLPRSCCNRLSIRRKSGPDLSALGNRSRRLTRMRGRSGAGPKASPGQAMGSKFKAG